MNRVRAGFALALAGLLVSAAPVGADVKTREKTQVKFEGMMGKVTGVLGGKAAKEGVVQTVAVKGDRKATFGDTTGEIVDLAEEKVYEINVKDKSYRVLTFAEIRKKLQEDARKAEEEARRAREEEKTSDEPQKEMTIDFDVKATGQQKTINGYNCREVLVTVSVYEKGKTLEQAGGFVMTVDSWLAPRIAEMKEISDFDLRYARKISGDATLASAQGMLPLMALYPGFQKAMDKMAAEQGNLDGTPIQSVTTMHTVMSPEQAKAKKEESRPSGPGGVVGGMLGRFGRKKAEEPKGEAGGAAGGSSRILVMTSTSEVLSIAPTAAAADVAVPAGFRQK